MILPGHVAAATLVSLVFETDLRVSLAVSMFPDLVDKPVRWLLNLVPNDRIPAHTALGWTLTTGMVRLVFGKGAARAWLVGYGSHLLCDEINAHLNPGRIYFWWPLRRYTMHVGPTGLRSSLRDFTPASLLAEAAVVLLALGVWADRLPKRQAFSPALRLPGCDVRAVTPPQVRR